MRKKRSQENEEDSGKEIMREQSVSLKVTTTSNVAEQLGGRTDQRKAT